MGRVLNRYSHQKRRGERIRPLKRPRCPPRGVLVRLLCMLRPIFTPRPPPDRGAPPPLPPGRVTHDSHRGATVTFRSDPQTKNNRAKRDRRWPRRPYTCTRLTCAAMAMVWGWKQPLWTPFVAVAHDSAYLQGRERARAWGRRGRFIVRMRPKGAVFEALGLLRTFLRGPAAAQWAVAGGAPAPRLNDRSRPLPQRGNG